MTQRAAIYARYSSEHQREASIADQVRLCEERIGREGWTRAGTFQDAGVSGATPLRPGYQALLTAARAGEFDVVVAEALDRLSRDQEDVAALFKRLHFAGIAIVTLAEGRITPLHVGLKGAMNSIFLQDLADKTRRGLRGRIENRRSGGGNSFGYDVVPGEGHRGERIINDAQAAVVRRIFENYAAGMSPKRIALQLNKEGVRTPHGGCWSSSTINGNRRRGTGIVNNEVYVGRIVWNRLAYVKEPETGRRRSRLNPSQELVVVDVPEWRIIPDALWQAVRARQAALDGSQLPPQAPSPFWAKQRPRYLFSGLMRCGVCGGGFSKISANHFGCSTARNKGPTACTNVLTIRRDALERETLESLRSRLMDPALFKVFAAGFTAEWNRLQAEADGEQQTQRAELDQVRRQIE